MQLTEVQCLTAEYSQTDVYELVATKQSTVLSVPVRSPRWANVTPLGAQKFLLRATAQSLVVEFQNSRIAPILDAKEPPSTPHAEHLVVRDLDLDHLESSEHTTTPAAGRIVAHADYRYFPAFDRAAHEAGAEEATDEPPVYPEGFGKDLHIKLNTMVESTLANLFGGLPCFELYGISTLTPSHLRKGIASKLTTWIFPYADHFSLPVVLCASPMGLPLYRKCGFEEYREHDVRIDLEQFGGEGLHFHVPMVRWPVHDDKMPMVWKDWRARHRAGPVAIE